MDGAAIALAVPAVLNLVIGTVLWTVSSSASPPSIRRPRSCGCDDGADERPSSWSTCPDPSDQQELFDYTLDIVVRAVVEP